LAKISRGFTVATFVLTLLSMTASEEESPAFSHAPIPFAV
jgi:hypothetical protein